MEKGNNCSILMARRLRELRQKRGLTFEGLRNELLQYTGVDISIESLKNYEVSQENHPRAFRNEGMRAELVRALATYYGVTSDYLLGISDEPDRFSAPTVGLNFSQESAEWLQMKQEDCRKGKSFDLELFFGYERFRKLLDALNEYLAAIAAANLCRNLFGMYPPRRSAVRYDELREAESNEKMSIIREMVNGGCFGNDLIREKMQLISQLHMITKESPSGERCEIYTSQDVVDLAQHRVTECFLGMLSNLRITDLWNRQQMNGVPNFCIRRDSDPEGAYFIVVVEHEHNPKKRKIHTMKWRPTPGMTKEDEYKAIYSVASEFAERVAQE